MPTGYTEVIERGATFEQYLWRCVRGMGATIMQRDDDLDARVITRQEPQDFYTENRVRAEARLRELESTTTEQAQALMDSYYSESLARHERYVAEHKEKETAYKAMAAKVRAWKPPTAEHAGLKEFMLEQIERGRPGPKCYSTPPKKVDAVMWLHETIADARSAVNRAREAEADEAKRAAQRSEWLQAIERVVPQPAPLPRPVR